MMNFSLYWCAMFVWFKHGWLAILMRMDRIGILGEALSMKFPYCCSGPNSLFCFCFVTEPPNAPQAMYSIGLSCILSLATAVSASISKSWGPRRSDCYFYEARRNQDFPKLQDWLDSEVVHVLFKTAKCLSRWETTRNSQHWSDYVCSLRFSVDSPLTPSLPAVAKSKWVNHLLYSMKVSPRCCSCAGSSACCALAFESSLIEWTKCLG